MELDNNTRRGEDEMNITDVFKQVLGRAGLLAVCMAVLCAFALQADAMTLYEDTETGQLFTKPGPGREQIEGEVIIVKPDSSEAASAPAGDYSGQAFADAVNNVIGERESKTYPKFKLGGEAYVGYSYDFDDEVTGSHGRNKFSLNRGYINIKTELTPQVRTRITPDISRKSDGDYELRLKYYYVDFHDFLESYPSLQVKLGQFEGAWLDHEEHLWTYRVQGTMMIEREHFMNSANLGVNFQGKLPAGYGEWQALVCNGEGYHADETNKYKSVQARLTLHPLPGNEWTKGLELTGFTFFGRKDDTNSRDMYDFLLGYEYKKSFFVGAEYLMTHGSDHYVAGHDAKNNLDGAGVSVLGWARMPFMEELRLMARWDHFDHDLDSPANTVNRYIYGVSYDLNKYVTFLVDNERTVAKSFRGGYTKAEYPDENLFKVDVLLKY